jgi:hypothetical protein
VRSTAFVLVAAFLVFVWAERVYAHPPTVADYTALGSFQTSSLDSGGIVVTGSANVNVLNLNGLGVVGGIFDDTIDGSEFLKFSFSSGVALEVSYEVSSAGNQDGDGLAGEAILEAFDVGGASLGTVAVSGTGTHDVSGLFGNAGLSAFRVTAVADNHRISKVSYAGGFDHYKCYKATRAKGSPKFQNRDVTLEDQFGKKETSVMAPVSVCTPVAKNGTVITAPELHMVCYVIKDTKGQAKFVKRNVLVTNGLGEQTLTLVKPQVLCVPSLKTLLP